MDPLDRWNLWNPFNRIRIIMGKFGCTQIRTSSSCSSERKKDFGNLFLGFWIFWPKFFSFFGVFLYPKNDVFGQKKGLQVGVDGSFWLKCCPSSADWSLKVISVSHHREKFPIAETEALLSKNRPKLTKIHYAHNANFARTHLQTC